jgi:hypothetical protein
MELHFSQHFNIDPRVLQGYGAFDISVVSDLPLFVDPFLLFHSTKQEYQDLHQSILRYLYFLRDTATEDLDPATIRNLYRFKEVKQNWLGFSVLGNGGSGLGQTFADALHSSLGSILQGFGSETVTRTSHLEKLCLIRPGVGRDNISDFTTNLIKDYLCQYTSTFAQEFLRDDQVQEFAVTRAAFNFGTRSWETRRYTLPALRGDYVLLTPIDMLTCDETWINHSDLVRQFPHLPEALPDAELRAQVDRYFRDRLGKDPTAEVRAGAIEATVRRYPQLIDFYIRKKEDEGEQAEAVSSRRVRVADEVFVDQLRRLLTDLDTRTDFYNKPASSYEECLDRARHFKHYIEDQDGYRLINRDGQPFSNEKEVQLYFGLVWYGSAFDVNREPDNGRGPVDFKISKGSIDKSLIEFKLGSNSKLKRNLERQVAIYQAANQTQSSVKVIICYTESDQARVARVLKELDLQDEESVIVIDARGDNKPSGSRA